MRKAFFEAFCREQSFLLYDDVGFGVIDQSHPRVINVGIAEQAMVGMAAGMASEGARVYCYAIAPHFIRAWEFARNMVAGTGRDVTLVGVGVGDDYKALGKTHAITSQEISLLCHAIGLPYYCPFDRGSLGDALAQRAPKFLHLGKARMD